MKTLQLHSAPLTAALYLRRCEEKRNSQACRRIDMRESLFRGACLSIAGLASASVLVAMVNLAMILSK